MQGISSTDPRLANIWNNRLTPDQADALYRTQGNYNPQLDTGMEPNPYFDLRSVVANALQNASLGTPASPPMPEAVAPEDGQDVGIQGSRLHGGLLGGFFGVGHTGGNILGILGDSLRAQGGLAPMYQPRLQQARMAEAAQGFVDNPMEAVGRMMRIDTPTGLAAYDKASDAQARQATAANQAATQARLDAAARERTQREHFERGLRFLASGTDQPSYTSARGHALAYWAQHGVDPSAFGLDMETLPETFDADRVRNARMLGMPTNQQMTAESQADYRNMTREDIQARREQARADMLAERSYRHNRDAHEDAMRVERPVGWLRRGDLGLPPGTVAVEDGYHRPRILVRPPTRPARRRFTGTGQ